MATIKIYDLNDASYINELIDNDLNEINGGGIGDWFKDRWKDVKHGYKKFEGGLKRFGEGGVHGSRNDRPRHKDLWYNGGYIFGKWAD